MKEAFIDKNIHVSILDVAIPEPGAGQVLIRTVVSGTNPKDWKIPTRRGGEPFNQGDDIAGFIEAVGDGVAEFHRGDRVAAFHEMLTPHGSYAEYSIAWAKSTFHIPSTTSFEEAATIPLAAMTAALGLYQNLRLPTPWAPALERTPLIINGGSTSVGAFAIKLAALSNLHPIIAIAGRGSSFVETLIDPSKGDTIVDYRQDTDSIIAQVRKASDFQPILYGFETVGSPGSAGMVSRIVDQGKGQVTTVMPIDDSERIPGVHISRTVVGTVHKPEKHNLAFGAVLFKYFSVALTNEWLTGHPFKVVKSGLNGLEDALRDLKAGKVSAYKYVLRLADT